MQRAGIQSEVVGLAIDGHGQGERIAVVFHDHGPYSAVDLIWSSLEAFERVPLLLVLWRPGEGRTPLTVGRGKPRVQARCDVPATEQRIRIIGSIGRRL